MTFTLLLLSMCVLVVGLYFSASREKSRLASFGWDQLVAELEPVRMEGITKVALDYLNPSKGQTSIETGELWFLVGEAEGLRRMESNAEVLIALAGLAQQWDFQESVIVGERMRRDGLTLRRAARRVSIGLFLGYGKTRGPFSVQEAASAYYLMKERLLALHERSYPARYASLAAALGQSGAASISFGAAI